MPQQPLVERSNGCLDATKALVILSEAMNSRISLPPLLSGRQAPRHPSPKFALKETLTGLAVFFAVCLPPPIILAQDHSHSMTDAEVEQVRELAYLPNERVALFQKFMDQRIADIEKISAAKRVNDRPGQLHDLMDQFAALADELDDNLDDYQQRHWDVRKALRKLSDDSGKWAAVLVQPPPDPAYEVTRKLALEAARDIHGEAQKLLDDQTAWFAAHPPVKEEQKGPVIIPR